MSQTETLSLNTVLRSLENPHLWWSQGKPLNYLSPHTGRSKNEREGQEERGRIRQWGLGLLLHLSIKGRLMSSSPDEKEILGKAASRGMRGLVENHKEIMGIYECLSNSISR